MAIRLESPESGTWNQRPTRVVVVVVPAAGGHPATPPPPPIATARELKAHARLRNTGQTHETRQREGKGSGEWVAAGRLRAGNKTRINRCTGAKSLLNLYLAEGKRRFDISVGVWV